MALYRDQGIVLRTIKLGEADRIVTLLTEGRGKVRAVAKGVRKTKSRFGSRLEPGSHVALQLYEGRQLDTITQAETLDHFRSIREDLDRLGRATFMLEAADHVAQEGEANARLYQMLVGALRSLAAVDAPLLVPAFFLKLLSLEGVHPALDHCAVCDAGDADLVAYSALDGGAVCARCHGGGRGRPTSPEAFRVLQLVLGGGLARALAEPRSRVTDEIDRLATSAMEHHLERRLRSSSVFD
jgi:DNA repair protein RecO (recombination protein O)